MIARSDGRGPVGPASGDDGNIRPSCKRDWRGMVAAQKSTEKPQPITDRVNQFLEIYRRI